MKRLYWGLAALALIVAGVFVLSLFNIAFFDFQCKDRCYECTSNPLDMQVCPTLRNDYPFVCLKGCRVRNFRCSYDLELKSTCCHEVCYNRTTGSTAPSYAWSAAKCYESCAA